MLINGLNIIFMYYGFGFAIINPLVYVINFSET